MTDPARNDVAAPDDTAPAPFASPSPYAELAAALISAVDRFMDAVPEFGFPVAAPDFVDRKRRIPIEFVNRAVNALMVRPELQSIEVLDPRRRSKTSSSSTRSARWRTTCPPR